MPCAGRSPVAPMCPCSLQRNCCGGGSGDSCAGQTAGSLCLAPPHRHGELEKVMTEADSSRMQTWGRHFLGRTLRLSRSSGCVQFMAAALTLTVSVSAKRPGRVLQQERPPAVSKRWEGLLFSKTVAG